MKRSKRAKIRKQYERRSRMSILEMAHRYEVKYIDDAAGRITAWLCGRTGIKIMRLKPDEASAIIKIQIDYDDLCMKEW